MQMADRRVSKLRPSCLKSYAAGMGGRSEGMGTPTVVSKGRNAGRTPAFVEASLLGDRWESLARSLWYIPGSGKGPPGFYGKETLEKPDNNLSITPHRPVGNSFRPSPPTSLTPMRQECDSRYFHHNPRVRTRRRSRISSRLARSLCMSTSALLRHPR